jgi:hypothetical protein
MTSNEWVALPMIIESRRIHPISYMKEDRPVPNATTSSRRVRPARARGSAEVVAAPATIGGCSLRCPTAMTAIRMLSAAAQASVPGSPKVPTSTKPESRAPSAAPMLLVK